MATQEIAACEKIGEAKPFAKAVDRTNHLYCLTCNNTVRKNYVICPNCESVVFCGKKRGNQSRCRAANLTHQYECGSNFHAIEYGSDIDIKCAMQMVFEALVAYNNNVPDLMNAVSNMLDQNNVINLAVPVRINNAQSRFEVIMRLQGKSTDKLESYVHQAYSTIMELQSIYSIFTTDQHERFLRLLLAHFLMVLPENAFEGLLPLDPNDRDAAPEDQPLRTMIFDTFSFFNHSCSPNVLAYKEWNTITLITSRVIPNNHELCISYIHFDQTVKKPERQKTLQDSWGFACRCQRCEYRTEIDDNAIKSLKCIPNPNQDDATFRRFQTDMNAQVSQVQKNRGWTLMIGAFGIKYHDVLKQRADIT